MCPLNTIRNQTNNEFEASSRNLNVASAVKISAAQRMDKFQ
jgi:hypothetical protein